MITKDFNSKIFIKKKNQKYYRNKLFSYSNKNRNNKNFNYKDFRHSNSIHSTFIQCKFFGTLFKKSKLKYCSFNGAMFIGITFINCNFKGSRFFGATFKDCIFKNCNFQKCNFKDAIFINTYNENSSFKISSNLKIDWREYSIKNLTMVEQEKINILSNKYKGTNIHGLINKIDISRLLILINFNKLDEILDDLKNNTKIKNATFSHVIAKI